MIFKSRIQVHQIVLRLTLALCLGAGLAAPVIAATSSHAPTFSTAQSAVTHAPSGFLFPLQIGNFQRVGTRFQTYNTEGTDVSIGYNSTQLPMVITVYVYPVNGQLLANEFISKQNEIRQHYSDAHLDSSGNVLVTPEQLKALSARYHFHANFAGKYQLVSSQLVVGQSGDYFVEYRITYPADWQTYADMDAIYFTSAFDWPKP